MCLYPLLSSGNTVGTGLVVKEKDKTYTWLQSQDEFHSIVGFRGHDLPLWGKQDLQQGLVGASRWRERAK